MTRVRSLEYNRPYSGRESTHISMQIILVTAINYEAAKIEWMIEKPKTPPLKCNAPLDNCFWVPHAKGKQLISSRHGVRCSSSVHLLLDPFSL